jgi:hypothetical protein
MVKAANDAVSEPSLTVMTIPLVAPTSAGPGVPDSRPVAELNEAQAGALATLNVSVLPSGSDAVGVNAYALPCRTAVGGLPVIVGGRFGGKPTVIEKAGNCAAPPRPSFTEIVTFADVPTFAVVGVPCSRPVVVLNAAQLGRLLTPNVSVLPSGSLAVGVNVYAVPTIAVVVGVPEIVGGLFVATTVIENVGSAADSVPSLTLIAMFANVPTFPPAGVP